jgi:phenylacetate-coenzyme A ligase PaaK-like adenylate-forming protein
MDERSHDPPRATGGPHRARPDASAGDLEPIETAPVEEIVLGIPTLSPHFQCHLDRAGNLDTLTVRVEPREVGVASIERSAGKMRRIVDHRAAR